MYLLTYMFIYFAVLEIKPRTSHTLAMAWTPLPSPTPEYVLRFLNNSDSGLLKVPTHHPFSLKACLSHLLEVHPKTSNPINTQMFSKLRIPWLAHSHVASHRSSVTWKKTYIQKLENEESYSSSFFYCADSIVRIQAC